jgi:hydroxymethylpyrimidine kinase/phosphomethylpyrimidine kinase/thiamine-phosphate diphosphorylase
MKPIVWTIAGSDNSGGAGIQADLKIFEMMGVHGCTIITALTAQNSHQVLKTESVSADMLAAQIDILKTDMPPGSIKIGMLGDAASVKTLIQKLKELQTYTVYDPVMIASAGASLMQNEVFDLIKSELLPLINLLTPNLNEAEKLSGLKIKSDADMVRAAEIIMSLGPKAIIIKGWHSGDGFVQDFYQDKNQKFWLTSPAREKISDARGTGCSFASICAAAHALAYTEADAVAMSKGKINQFVRGAKSIGKGIPILTYSDTTCSPDDFPWLTLDAASGRARLSFPDCGAEPLGFYPVVDSIDWLRRLLPLGVSTAQLRIKNKNGAKLEREICAAIALGKEYHCRLFINDYWQLAIKHHAYGVHLGQEDIETADMKKISDAGLRLGLSTHCYEEVARAVAAQPSYIAIGPIFHTTLKAMNFAPQGISALARWRQMLRGPLVAIGGIRLEQAPEILAAGADSIAVVSDVTQNKNPEARTKAWLELFRLHHGNAIAEREMPTDTGTIRRNAGGR